jgi:hypothetical protein
LVQRLARHPEASTRRWVAFSFPALVVGEAAADFRHTLLPLFSTLAKDDDATVRHTLMTSLHEVLKVVSVTPKDLQELLRVAFPLLASGNSPITRALCATQLIAVLASVKKLPHGAHAAAVAKYVNVLEALEEAGRDWRTREALFRALEPLPAFCVGLDPNADASVAPPLAAVAEDIYARFLPVLFDTFRHGAAPVRPAACRVLCQFLRFQVSHLWSPTFSVHFSSCACCVTRVHLLSFICCLIGVHLSSCICRHGF